MKWVIDLRVSPLRGVKRFGVKGKLAPRYVGPFKILSRKGEVAYEIELPKSLSAVHNVFHVSHLKKCHPEMEESSLKDTIPLEEVQLESCNIPKFIFQNSFISSLHSSSFRDFLKIISEKQKLLMI